MLVKTDINAQNEAVQTTFLPRTNIPATDTQKAIEYLRGLIATLAPLDATFIVASADATLTNERVVTDNTHIAWDLGTAGQLKATIVEPELAALAGLTSAADRVPYFTGSGTAALATFTSYGRSLVAVADEAAFKALVNLEIGTDVQAFDADLSAIAALASTGFAVRTASNTWAQRSVAGTANEITATNGDGVGGNPTLSLPAALTFTGKTVTGGTFSGPSLSGTIALASGSILNWNASDVVVTHSAGLLTMGTGDLRITNAGTNAASVVTVGGTQTLTSKTLTSPVINTGTIGTSLLPTANDGAALGASGTAFADLFLASGGVINWNAGNYTITHTAGDLAFSGIVTLSNTGLHLLDTNASHDLIISPGSNITADRTLTLTTGDTNITLNLTDPGADRIMFWDDSAATWRDLTLTAGLTISGTEIRLNESFVVACSDETTNLTTGTAKVKWRMPYAFTVTAVRASLSTAQTAGSIFTVDINEGGTTILSTKLTIDNNELTSTTAATPAVISDTALADDAEMSVDIDQVGTAGARGLKITIIGYRP